MGETNLFIGLTAQVEEALQGGEAAAVAGVSWHSSRSCGTDSSSLCMVIVLLT